MSAVFTVDPILQKPLTCSVPSKPSPVIDTRVIYCGDCLEQLRKLPDACVDLIYIDPPFNSNRNYEVFWGETKEKRARRSYSPAPSAARSTLIVLFSPELSH